MTKKINEVWYLAPASQDRASRADDSRAVDDPISNFNRTRILSCVFERTDGMKTIDSLIDSLYRVATASVTDRQLEIIENKLLNLAIGDDAEAAGQYADLYLCRMKWERTRSAEDWQDFVNQAHEAKAWLAVNSL